MIAPHTGPPPVAPLRYNDINMYMDLNMKLRKSIVTSINTLVESPTLQETDTKKQQWKSLRNQTSKKYLMSGINNCFSQKNSQNNYFFV